MDESIILTLVAICVLESFFEENSDEWQLIAQKARNYLKQNNINIKQELTKISCLI